MKNIIQLMAMNSLEFFFIEVLSTYFLYYVENNNITNFSYKIKQAD